MPFVASKFKNTTPRQPKKEDCISDLPIFGLTCSNDGIRANRNFISFYIDGEGGKLGVLPVDAKGRKQRDDINIICAHSDSVSDFAFLPFEENTLLTCCKDDKVKIWKLDQNCNVGGSVGTPEASFDLPEGLAAECLVPHTTASNIVAIGAGNGASIYDVSLGAKQLEVEGMSERVLSGSWDGHGSVLALADKSRGIGMFDPRAGPQPTSFTDAHLGLGREIRVLCLGNTGKVLTSGFSKTRYREIFLYDQRKFTSPYHTQQFDTSTGILIPIYDADTGLLYLAGKGSNKINLCEIKEKAPHITDVYAYGGSDQTLGACLVPKTALDVMSGEVGKILQLTRNAIFPISCTVPRKSYRDFIPELFPPTADLVPGCDSAAWFSGSKNLPPVYSLDPTCRKDLNVKPASTVAATKKPSQVPAKLPPSGKENSVPDHKPPILSPKPRTPPPKVPSISDRTPEDNSSITTTTSSLSNDSSITTPSTTETSSKSGSSTTSSIASRISAMDSPVTKTPASSVGRKPGAEVNGNHEPEANGVKFRSTPINDGVHKTPAGTPFRPMSIIGPTSKFRHVVATPGLKETMFTNIRKTNTRMPLESNGFCVSNRWCAVPIAGPGGVVLILDVEKPGKLPDGVIPGIENHSAITDMGWCPFDESELAVGCDNGLVKLWRIPAEGITELEDEPCKIVEAHEGKVICLRYNPVYRNVLVTAGNDRAICFWDLSATSPLKKLSLHDNDASIIAMSWSANGQRLATAAKDAFVRIYEPQASPTPVLKKKLLESTRGARLIFVCGDSLLAIISFSKGSDRQITLYNSDSLDVIHSSLFDPSPQLLIPHYDYDSSVLFLTAKGDRMIQMYEIVPDSPYLMKLATHTSAGAHQAISFMQKNTCNVRKVEFAKAFRLTLSTVEPLVFTVPRVKKDLFQNDLFPDSLVQWEAEGEAADWFNGTVIKPKYKSLRPSDMDNLYPEPNKTNTTTAGHEQEAGKSRTAKDEVEPKEEAKHRNIAFPQKQASFDDVISKPVEKEDFMVSIGDKMEQIEDGRGLEQDNMEGVDDDEWADV